MTTDMEQPMYLEKSLSQGYSVHHIAYKNFSRIKRWPPRWEGGD
jgi:hypothetical protein